MDGDDMYDEFGNYVGPEMDSDDDGDDFQAGTTGGLGGDALDEQVLRRVAEGGATAGAAAAAGTAAGEQEDDAEAYASAIVLHEDKKYYPDADEVYPDAEVLVQEEDSQPITQPIVEPVKVKKMAAMEASAPETTYSTDFMTALMRSSDLLRNVAVIGQLHHGKTSLLDLLIEQTHTTSWKPAQSKRYTDSRADEQTRGVSIKSTPVSLVLPASSGKSYLLNLIDCPGHPNFNGEVAAGVRLSDGVLLVVDAVEGLMVPARRQLEAAVRAGNSVVLVINKIDRLVLELKLPPQDAYFKLLHTVEEVNAVVLSNDLTGAAQRISPERGNVLFASSEHRWVTSVPATAARLVEQWRQTAVAEGVATGAAVGASADAAPARLGSARSQQRYGPELAAKVARRMWGNWFFDSETGEFVKGRANRAGQQRAFVAFLLEPIYKVYAHAVGEEGVRLQPLLDEIGVELTEAELLLDTRPLMRLIFAQWLGSAAPLVDAAVDYVGSPRAAAQELGLVLPKAFDAAGMRQLPEPVRAGVEACDPSGPLVVDVCKVYPTPDATGMLAFGRVLSGTARPGDRVRVLGEQYTLEDDEDVVMADVELVEVSQARYTIPVSAAPAGCWCLLRGVGDAVGKSATVVRSSDPTAGETPACRAVHSAAASVVKLAVEALRPAELPRLVSGLRKVSQTYPGISTRVEESGEHVLLATGELQADCALADLRLMYGDLEVKVANPATALRETVRDTSQLPCHADTPNSKNRLTFMASPLEVGLEAEVEAGDFSMEWPADRRAAALGKHGWDVLASRNLWAFGPTDTSPNALVNDTLPVEVDAGLVAGVRTSVVQGFQWAAREGPLCDEPMRGVKVRLVDASLADQPIMRGAGQIIPTARKAVYSSFLMATPCIMEPMYYFEAQCPANMIEAVVKVAERRRGHVISDKPIPGSPFYSVQGHIPVLDSFGFETDLRVHTVGQAFVLQTFDHWSVAPGDPLDRSVVLRPLERSDPSALARELMVKTRRRKGLSEDVSPHKFFDRPMLVKVAELQAHQAAMAGAGAADLSAY